jgi:protein phosphatase
MSTLNIPDLSLVVLIGVSGSGKSFFAHKHFKSTEIISSDECRGWVCDDPSNQSVSSEAFELLHFIASKRLAIGRLTVIDATNVNERERRSLLNLAHTYHFIPVAIALHIPEEICVARNVQREERKVDASVIRYQQLQLEYSLSQLDREGFKYIYILDSEEKVKSTVIERKRMHSDLKHDKGPLTLLAIFMVAFLSFVNCFNCLVMKLKKKRMGPLSPFIRLSEER